MFFHQMKWISETCRLELSRAARWSLAFFRSFRGEKLRRLKLSRSHCTQPLYLHSHLQRSFSSCKMFRRYVFIHWCTFWASTGRNWSIELTGSPTIAPLQKMPFGLQGLHSDLLCRRACGQPLLDSRVILLSMARSSKVCPLYHLFWSSSLSNVLRSHWCRCRCLFPWFSPMETLNSHLIGQIRYRQAPSHFKRSRNR